MIIWRMCCPGRQPVGDIGVPIWDKDRKGNLPNYIECLRQALSIARGPITICEDDTEIPVGFPDYVEYHSQWIERTAKVVQWWTNGRMWTAGDRADSYADRITGMDSYFVHRPAGKFVSTQAVTYSKRTAQLILDHLEKTLPHAPTDDLGRKHSCDFHVGRALYNAGQDFFIHWPPVVNHVGVESLVAPGMTLDDGFRSNPHYSRNNAAFIVTRRTSPIVLYPGQYDE